MIPIEHVNGIGVPPAAFSDVNKGFILSSCDFSAETGALKASYRH
jgi:hypothetical protein